MEIGEALGLFTALLVTVGPFAEGVTKAVDAIRNTFDKDDRAPKWSWNAAAFVIGVLGAVGFGWNLMGSLAASIPALADSTLLEGTAGEVLTGLLIGGFAAYWHENMDAKSAVAKTGTSTTT